MSQLTHPRVQFVNLKFRARTWVAVLAALVVLAVPAALIVASGDDSATTNQASATGQLRYDGGPDEGTRGISAQAPSQSSSGPLRYDGGPNEGTRGIPAQSASQSSSDNGSDVFGQRP